MGETLNGLKFYDLLNYVISGAMLLNIYWIESSSYEIWRERTHDLSLWQSSTLILLSTILGMLVFGISQGLMCAYKRFFELFIKLGEEEEQLILTGKNAWEILTRDPLICQKLLGIKGWIPHCQLTFEYRRQCVSAMNFLSCSVQEGCRRSICPCFKQWVNHPIIRARAEDVAYASEDNAYLFKLSSFRRFWASVLVVFILWSALRIFFAHGECSAWTIAFGVVISIFMFIFFDRQYFIQECSDGLANLDRMRTSSTTPTSARNESCLLHHTV